MLVEALVGGTVRTRLLLDTGAEFTVLSTAAARRLALNLGSAAVIPLRQWYIFRSHAQSAVDRGW